MAARSPLSVRILSIAAAALAAVLLLAVATPLVGERDLQAISGPIVVEAFHRGQPLGQAEIALPGLLTSGGLPADARVTATWPIEVKATDPAGYGVWIERPLYAGRLYWDGRLVDEVGEVDGDRRSEQSLFASLPATEPGRHEIALELQGDYGKGGVVGRIIHGPMPQVWRIAARVEAEKIALVLLLSSLAMLHLLLAGRRQQRWIYVFFGLFALALALYVFLRTDLSAQLFGEAPLPLRLRRLVTAWLGPLGLGLATTFEKNHPPPWLLALLACAGTVSTAALVLPMTWLPVLEILFDGLMVASALAFLVVVVPLAMRGIAGASVLALSTMVPLTWGTISEVLVTNGILPGGSHLMPTVAMLGIGMTAALMWRDAVASERLDRLVRSSTDAMLRVNRGGAILDTNPAADRLLGPRARGANLLEWIVADDQVLLRAHLADSPHRPERAELRLRGRATILESVAAELDDRTVLLMLRDVTRRRQLDEGLLQAARMETLAVLVGGLAHDFNNMLGTLLAHVGFLQATNQDNTKLRTRLGRMEATIERASQLTRGLLALTRGTSSFLEPTELHRIVQAAVERVRPAWPDRNELSIDVPADLPPVAAATADLEQALVNLLINARDASGRTGAVRVIARPFQSAEGARGVLCAIEDDGPGVPLELREQIFAPFFSTREKREGVGLGLAVAKQVVREHQGRLWVEDRPGGGARFCLALHESRSLDGNPEATATGQRVVVVDDEIALRDSWSSALQKRGYTVVSFADGAEASAWLSENRPDILVTDVLLPGLNGLQLTALCRTLHPDVPVLIVSGYIPDDTLTPDARVRKLDKPIRTSRLVAAVGRALAGESASDPSSGGERFPPLDGLTWEATVWGTPSLPPRRVGPHGAAAAPPTDLIDEEATGPVSLDDSER